MSVSILCTPNELEEGLDTIRQSPKDQGKILLIVRRPAKGQREIVTHAELDPTLGMVGDCWSLPTADRLPDPANQITLMNARVIALLSPDPTQWQLSGDQLFVELDLSIENLPAGTRLTLGAAEIEITPKLHTGCKKFTSRFGSDATKFVNSPTGLQLRLRGVNARVVQPGVIRPGDIITKRN